MAAGLGFKTFTTGEVLTAADTNGYLMQGVLVFTNAAARDAAITAPQEGQTCYLKSTDAVMTYSGSTWVAVGGGSSPLTTKGDLYTFSTVDARLPVGTNGQVLTADSSEATGLKFATPAGGSGLTLISTTTIGPAVTFVTVTNAFSATYDNYQIMISGGVASASCDLNLQLGSTTTGYYEAGFYNLANNSALVGDSTDNGAIFLGFGSGSTNALNGIGQCQAPNLAKFTSVQYAAIRNATGDSIASRSMGFEASTTQHTDFTISVGASANITGGTIKVYGYANS